MESNVTVLLFGAFRQYSDDGKLLLKVSSQGSVAELRKLLSKVLKEKNPMFSAELLENSVLGNNEKILEEDFLIDGDCELALLPPVCGG